jgi:hypothetical protein
MSESVAVLTACPRPVCQRWFDICQQCKCQHHVYPIKLQAPIKKAANLQTDWAHADPRSSTSVNANKYLKELVKVWKYTINMKLDPGHRRLSHVHKLSTMYPYIINIQALQTDNIVCLSQHQTMQGTWILSQHQIDQVVNIHKPQLAVSYEGDSYIMGNKHITFMQCSFKFLGNKNHRLV